MSVTFTVMAGSWVDSVSLPWATGLQTSLQLVTRYNPDDDPIQVELAREHLRTSDPLAEETYIQHLIAASLGRAQQKTQRTILPETYRLSLSAFPSGQIELPLPPLIAVESITYVDDDDVETTLDSDFYILNAGTGPDAGRAILSLASGVSWPSTAQASNAVSITFRAGYINRLVSPEVVDVPALITHARLLVISDLYENRSSGITGAGNSSAPNMITADDIFFSYRDLGRAG